MLYFILWLKKHALWSFHNNFVTALPWNPGDASYVHLEASLGGSIGCMSNLWLGYRFDPHWVSNIIS